MKTIEGVYHQKQDKHGNSFWESLHSNALPFSPDNIVRVVWERLNHGVRTPTGGELKVSQGNATHYPHERIFLDNKLLLTIFLMTHS
jgi:hypothetical protein